MPVFLNTNKPNIKRIQDFGPDDRIAVTAVKVSVHAIIELLSDRTDPAGSDGRKLSERIHQMLFADHVE